MEESDSWGLDLFLSIDFDVPFSEEEPDGFEDDFFTSLTVDFDDDFFTSLSVVLLACFGCTLFVPFASTEVVFFELPVRLLASLLLPSWDLLPGFDFDVDPLLLSLLEADDFSLLLAEETLSSFLPSFDVDLLLLPSLAAPRSEADDSTDDFLTDELPLDFLLLDFAAPEEDLLLVVAEAEAVAEAVAEAEAEAEEDAAFRSELEDVLRGEAVLEPQPDDPPLTVRARPPSMPG